MGQQELAGEQHDDGHQELIGKPPYQTTDLREVGHPVGGRIEQFPRIGEATRHEAISSAGVTTAQITRGVGDLSEAVRGLTGKHRLQQWWIDLAKQELGRLMPKVHEYGATDLRDIGHTLARTAGRVVDDEEAAELGIYFYLVGKMSRWTDAVARGERPSDDTLHDIGVYVRMAQRIRVAGGWPGVDNG